jgi:formylglycine-generating enzyme required for sulfatase activity
MTLLSVPHPFCVDLYEYPGGKTIPRTDISLEDASQVCASRGLRLCTDPEWEQACRGPNGASYPYGQSYDPQRCNTGSRAANQVEPAGAETRCRSAAGAYDMSGNVAEWTASGSQRGGSAHGAPGDARCSHVVKGASHAGSRDVGFRCCGTAR